MTAARPRRSKAAARANVLANRLNSAAIHLLRRIGRNDGADGVTGARLSALSVIVFAGASSVGELASREHVARPTMTRVIDGLERGGLVRRRPDARDRRVVRLDATTKGRKLMERGRSRRIRNLAGELAALADSEIQKLFDAVEALERLEQAARSGEEEAK